MKALSWLALGLFSLSSPAFAADEEKERFSILLGGGLTDNTLKIRDGGETRSQMVADRTLTYFVGFSKVPAPIFGLGFLRWSIEGEFTQFKTNKQVANNVSDVIGTDKHNLGNEVDFGNQVSGQTAYVTPTLSLFIGDPDGLYGYLGFGYGAGWANLSGEYIITEGAATPAACLSATTFNGVATNCPRESLDSSHLTIGSNAVMGFGWGNLGFKYFRGGPRFRANGHTFEPLRALGVVFYQLRF